MRFGLSRVEFLVAGCLTVLAVGLAVPAIQAARQLEARTQCGNNLQKLGKGFAEYEKVHGGLPPRRAGFNNGKTYAGWGAYILPYVGEEAVSRKYDQKYDFFDPANKEAVETQVKTYLCPASPDRVVPIQSQASTKSANPDKDTVYTVKCGPTDFISSNGMAVPGGGYGLNALATERLGGNQRQPMTDKTPRTPKSPTGSPAHCC
jgi:hypothetical protein